MQNQNKTPLYNYANKIFLKIKIKAYVEYIWKNICSNEKESENLYNLQKFLMFEKKEDNSMEESR
jgi:hypothetical protein